MNTSIPIDRSGGIAMPVALQLKSKMIANLLINKYFTSKSLFLKDLAANL